ncbi:Rpn family recombination-promoting nuclease/putative transposase [Lachnospiraceae bacterium 38-14]
MDYAENGKTTETRKFRRLEELNLLDDFLFQEMVASPEVGEEFCRILLRVILGKEVRKVRVIPQRAVQGAGTKRHGIRLDAYIEDVSREEVMGELDMLDAEVVQGQDIYDFEPNKVRERERLPRKMRYYHGLIDTKLLKASVSYEKLPNVFIIMILPYDPFGKNRMVYTVKSQCVEDNTVSYEDGAVKLFLYTKGKAGNPSQNLIDMLKYIERSTVENIINQDIKRIDELVRHIKKSEEVDTNYMKSWEWEKYIEEAATARGLARGLEKGLEQGLEQGLAQGLEKGLEQGLEQAMVKVILNMHENGYTSQQIAIVTEKTPEEVRAVIEKRTAVLA